MRRNAFTLIELLAVIVILAIIALIATPIIINIIEDSKSSSIKESANLYIGTVSKEISKLNLKQKLNPNKCIIVDSVLKCDGQTINVDIKGIKPTCGQIKYKDGKVISYSINIDNKLITKTKEDNIYIEDVNYCSMEVVDIEGGLTPVIYENGNWIITTEDDSNWYDYENQKWANAVILEHGVSNEVGKILKVDGTNPDVKAMLVYVPRYEYKIDGRFGKRLDGTDGTSDYPGAIDINFIPKEKTTPTEGYMIPPAFKFGDKELNGIWVGKFKTGVINKYSNSTLPPYVIPNVPALVEQDVATQFTTSRKFNEYLNNADSHMIKNSEWAAVAYLTESKYGKYGNSDYQEKNKQVYYNNSIDNYFYYYTGRSAGTYSGSGITDKDIYPNENTSNKLDSTYGFYTYDGYLLKYNTNEIDTTKAQNLLTVASTTGNIYGIYDMNGATEHVMGIHLQKNQEGEYTLYIGARENANSGFNGLYAQGGEKTDGIDLPNAKYYDTVKIYNEEPGQGLGELAYRWYPNSGGGFSQDEPFITRSRLLYYGSRPGASYYYGTRCFRIAITDE